MKKTKKILLLLITTASIAVGQIQEATTGDGKKVLLNADGTWKFASPIVKDSLFFDCDNLISSYTDKTSGYTLWENKKDILVTNEAIKKGFGISLKKTSNGSITMAINARGAGNCITGGSGINILFTDGTRIEMLGEGDMNCNKEAVIYFDNTTLKKKYREQLCTLKIKTLRVWTNDSYVENDFSKENQEEFYKIINCLNR